MPYITSTDLVAAIGLDLARQLTDPDNRGKVDETIFGEAVKGAEAKINAYLVKRYAVPIAVPVPEIVRQLSIDMTIHRLKTRGKSMATLEEIEAEKARTAMLKDISTGLVALDVDPGPTQSTLVVNKAGETMSAKYTAREARRGTW